MKHRETANSINRQLVFLEQNIHAKLPWFTGNQKLAGDL